MLSGILAAAPGGPALLAQEPQINARDAFFSAADLVAVNRQRAGAGKKSAKAAPAKSPQGVKTEPVRASGPKPELAAGPALKDSEAYFQQVSLNPQTAPPLGLRYSLLKKTEGGLREVATDSEFHAGDSIRLSVMGNRRGYLYVISRGSSGIWSPLFPHPESAQQANEIVPGRLYQIPGGEGEYFTFDEQPGEEKLFLLFSAKPVEDLEELIGTLSGRRRLPAGRPVRPARPQTMEAHNRFNDAWVEQLKAQVQSRDLVFTRVEKETAAAPSPVGGEPEAAVYVVNASAVSAKAGEGRVIADLTLRHK